MRVCHRVTDKKGCSTLLLVLVAPLVAVLLRLCCGSDLNSDSYLPICCGCCGSRGGLDGVHEGKGGAPNLVLFFGPLGSPIFLFHRLLPITIYALRLTHPDWRFFTPGAKFKRHLSSNEQRDHQDTQRPAINR